MSELNQAFGVAEFHASKLWGGAILNSRGSKKAKQEAESVIQGAFEKAVRICIDHGVTFIVQTVHRETFETFCAGLQSRSAQSALAARLVTELTASRANRKLVAFLMLSRLALRWTHKVAHAASDGQSDVAVRAWWNIDQSTDFGALSNDAAAFAASGFDACDFKFLPSDTSPLIQAADLAGYIVNRHLYFMANRPKDSAQDPKPSNGYLRAKSLLSRTQNIIPCIVNLPRVRLGDQQIHAEQYDQLLDEYRSSIDLPPLDFKKE